MKKSLLRFKGDSEPVSKKDKKKKHKHVIGSSKKNEHDAEDHEEAEPVELTDEQRQARLEEAIKKCQDLPKAEPWNPLDTEVRHHAADLEQTALKEQQSFLTAYEKKRGREIWEEKQKEDDEEVTTKKLKFSHARLKKLQAKGVDVDPISIYGDFHRGKKAKTEKDTRSNYEKMVDRREQMKSDRYCKGGLVG
eukprot:TRINITY_DN19150_c0_g1_i1.p1 TRINITY_DN19150_c0_g1~~TRINITY_DN19150_c0_g1_i1.p1  ORF type:complete len:201 (-),score=26.49 TRINITY_DN19150_c0_g1_i1:88-666(-)